MLRVADAGGRERQLTGIGLGVSDQVLRRLHRRIRRDYHHARHDADERYRNELPHRVVRHLLLVDVVVDRDLPGGRHQQCVAVGSGLGDGIRRDHRGSAGAVLHQHGLAERRLHRLAEKARHDIDAAAGRVADQYPDRLSGIALRSGLAAVAGDEHKRRTGSKLAAGQHRSSVSATCRPVRFRCRGSAAERQGRYPRGNRSRCPARPR